MPYQFDFDRANRILRCTWEGRVNNESIMEFDSVARKYVALTDPRAGILDFSAVTHLDVAPQTVRDLALSAPTIPDPSVPRFIVAPSPLVFGMSRMFEFLGEKTRPLLQVVHTLEETYAALGIKAPQFGPLQPIDPK